MRGNERNQLYSNYPSEYFQPAVPWVQDQRFKEGPEFMGGLWDEGKAAGLVRGYKEEILTLSWV